MTDLCNASLEGVYHGVKIDAIKDFIFAKLALRKLKN